MSVNQSRAERSESSQYRKSGRSGSSSYSRNFPGGSGKGGGAAPPPSSSSNNSSLPSSRSYRKSNNAQGGQSRLSSVNANFDSTNASAARTQQNGSHLQTAPLHGTADTPVSGGSAKPTSDISTQRSTRAVPKVPAPKPAVACSDSTVPAAFAKGQSPGEASRPFPLQFGSINASFGMQIPARTSSAPPNLDEQQWDQARHDSLRAGSTIPVPSVPKQQMSRKDGGDGNQFNTGEAHQSSKARRDHQVSSTSPVTQASKASVYPIPGVSVPMPYHQSQVPVQFGGANPQIPSQGMATTSLPMHMPIPLPMANAPQLQQPVFVPGMQSHSMQHTGIMHQGQSLNFSPQMGPQLAHQLGNMGISIGPQFAQQQAGTFGSTRKPVKITHPETREELRLDKRADAYADSGSSGPRSHSNAQQSQPITSVPPGHPINYFHNSYNPNPLIFAASNPVPLNNSQINPASQAPRFSYPVSQGTPAASFINPPVHNTYSSKNSSPMHGVTESSSLEHSHNLHSSIASTPSASVQVTIKPAIGLHAEKLADSVPVVSSSTVEKGVSPQFPQQPGEVDSNHLQRVSQTCLESSSTQPAAGLTSLPASGKQTTTVHPFYVEGLLTNSSSSVPPAMLEESTPVVTAGTENRRETVSRSDSFKDQQKKQIKKGHSQSQHEVHRQPSSISSLPSPSVQHTNPSNAGTAETVATNTAASSNTGMGAGESVSETSCIHGSSTVKASTTEGEEQGSTQESKMVGILACGDNWDTDYCNQELNASPKDETLKLGSMERKEQEGIILNEVTEQDKNVSETSLESVSEKSSLVIDQTQPNSDMNLITSSHEVGSLEFAQRDLEKTRDHGRKDDTGTDSIVMSTSSQAADATNAKTSSSRSSLLTGSDVDSKASTSYASLSRHDSLARRQLVTKSIPSDEMATPVSNSPPALEATSKHEGEGPEDVDGGLAHSAALKDKPVPELGWSKSNAAKPKKKIKEILRKADALGTTSDLYNAFKSPEEKKETVVSIDADQDNIVSTGKGGHIKSEPDDWEDAADISTPKLETLDDGMQSHGGLKHHDEDGNGVTSKKYSRDFLLKFSEQCVDLPEGFEITSDIAEALMVSNINASRESFSSPGRIIDRPSGGPRLDRRGSGIGDDDKWSKLPSSLSAARDPRMDSYGSNFRPDTCSLCRGILSGPMQSLGSQGGTARNGPDSERWQRAAGFQKGLIPSPQTPLQVMHKAEKKYEVGKVTDEEQAKQRQLKAILNKLTPQNFEKLFEQVKAVNIDSAATLTGAISQIFDKALMEPTFCEMYADFCVHLARELPNFNEDNEKITFRRLLLNKCQEEFERGEREQEEAERPDEEGEAKQSEEEREEKRIKARRRMLGNIRLIGELYKKKMLTERIMHECIKKLLGQYENPDEENIEALCKLMSTIGEIIDHSRAKEHMDAYFEMMVNLSNNMELSSRVRFMLKDAIDLRKSKWQQRRKVEGPKKIEEVHRDAAQERQVQAGRVARAPSMSSSARNRQAMDFGPRGSSMLSSPSSQLGNFRGPTPVRGYGAQDVRLDENRHSFDSRTPSLPLPQRSGEDSITLGPQGGLAKGMSGRGQPSITSNSVAEVSGPGDSRRTISGLNGYGSVSDRTVYGSRDDFMPRHTDKFLGPFDQSGILDRDVYHGNRDPRNPDRSLDRSRPASPIICNRPTDVQDVSSDKVWPEERLRDMSLDAIKEYYSVKDEKEVTLCIKDLNAPGFYPSMISIWVVDSFERKETERDLLSKLLINLSRPRDGMLNQDHLVKGFESVLANLEDAINDAPKAGEFLGQMLAKIILEKVIPFSEIGQLIYAGGEEKGSLVEAGLAAEVVGTILETIKSEKGEPVLNEIRMSSGLKLEKLRPPDWKRPLRLDKFI
ncbi:hypothetical protein NMG60_11023182 [Bertholletia excelsa]